MPEWFEVFDDEQVQLQTRRRVAGLSGAVVLAVMASLGILAGARYGQVPPLATVALLAFTWVGALRWLVRRLGALRRVVWCVKISDRCLVGYDYARRKTVFDWLTVERIELMPDGLSVHGPAPATLHIPHLFPDFPALSHRLIRYADDYGVPVFVDGRPWQQIDVYDLFPELLESASPDDGAAPA